MFRGLLSGSLLPSSLLSGLSGLALIACGACDRTAQEPATNVVESAPRPPPQAQAKATSPQPVPVAEPDGKFRYPGGERIVAIGDLHGDFAATEKAFRLAGAIDEAGKWSGGKLIVVQTGDQLDRGDDERQIIEFLSRLQDEAKKAGGALIVLNGNHETMNAMGDFRYVTPGAVHAFDSYKPASPLASRVSGEMKSRAAAFLPGGGAAKVLAERPIVAMVGDTVFAHGGVLPAHLDYGVDRMNEETRKWLEGVTTMPPSPVTDPQGPLWTRLYGDPSLGAAACATLQEVLDRLGAKRMAVGHTPQMKGLSSACDDKVFRIDVGLAAHYGDHPVQVLEIKNGAARILTAPN